MTGLASVGNPARADLFEVRNPHDGQVERWIRLHQDDRSLHGSNRHMMEPETIRQIEAGAVYARACEACKGTASCRCGVCDGSGEHECEDSRCSTLHECGNCEGTGWEYCGDCEATGIEPHYSGIGTGSFLPTFPVMFFDELPGYVASGVLQIESSGDPNQRRLDLTG